MQHSGDSGGGHYTAVCNQANKWYRFDDSKFEEINVSTVKNNSAYILFYKKQNQAPPIPEEYDLIVFTDNAKHNIIFPLLKAIYVEFIDNGCYPRWVRMLNDHYDLEGDITEYL